MSTRETAGTLGAVAPGRFLSRALLANAAFSIFCAVAALVFAQPIAAFMGEIQAADLRSLGVSLFIWAAVALFARTTVLKGRTNRWLVVAIIAGDLLWVAGSALLLVQRPVELTTGGALLIADVALAVGAFAVAQTVGLRRLG